MKTIICGPPHSGKSVFISNLIHLLPSGAYERINANGDGEGTWSNNPNQDEVLETRKKGTNSPEDFRRWKEQIVRSNQDIVLVDMGGRLQDDKIPLFEVCDNFIVISNDEKMIKKWKKFGKSHGCQCIGTIFSQQGELYEEIQSKEPYVKGVMSGFKRGHDLRGSNLLRLMADTVVSLSGYKGGYQKFGDSSVIDLYYIGIKLGMYQTWKTSSGIEVFNIWYDCRKLHDFYKYLIDNYSKDEHYKIYGARALYVSCVVCSCLSNEYANNLEFYSKTSKTFFPICKWSIDYSNKYTNLLEENEDRNIRLDITERDDCIRLKVTLPTRFYPEDGERIMLPKVDTNKKLLISGKVPAWVAVSLMLSYDNDQIYIHAPGIGYIKVVDKAGKQHGEILQW